MEHESDVGTSCNWYTWNNPKKLTKRTRRVEILRGSTISGPRGHGGNSNKKLLHIPQSSRTGVSTLNSLVSYQDTRWVRHFYPSAEMQSVYSTAPADWV